MFAQIKTYIRVFCFYPRMLVSLLPQATNGDLNKGQLMSPDPDFAPPFLAPDPGCARGSHALRLPGGQGPGEFGAASFVAFPGVE